MVLTKEYRIPLPFTLEEYQRGQLYMIAKASREQTNGSEGIEVLANERFQTKDGEGIYTHKVLHLSQRLPAWTRKLFGLDNVLQIEEKSWNIFPYCKTIYKSSLFGDRCIVTVETRHVADQGQHENAMGLSVEKLAARTVEMLDITQDPNDHSEEKLADPRSFESTKRKRGPLQPDWISSSKPVICAYKYVHVDFQFRALRSKIEHMILDVMKSIYLRTHRQAYVWMDEWIDLTEADLQKLEDEIHAHLNTTMKHAGNQQQSGVPPMPGVIPPMGSPSGGKKASNTAKANSSSPFPSPSKPEETEQPGNLEPPPRRLRARLRGIGTKLRAKL